MFDALAHGLPFIATNLNFFKEFSRQGLGITVKRMPNEFSNAIKRLEKNYSIIYKLSILLKINSNGNLLPNNIHQYTIL